MLPDRVSNPGPLTYESGALPIALRGPIYPVISKDRNSIYSSLWVMYGETFNDYHNVCNVSFFFLYFKFSSF